MKKIKQKLNRKIRKQKNKWLNHNKNNRKAIKIKKLSRENSNLKVHKIQSKQNSHNNFMKSNQIIKKLIKFKKLRNQFSNKQTN